MSFFNELETFPAVCFCLKLKKYGSDHNPIYTHCSKYSWLSEKLAILYTCTCILYFYVKFRKIVALSILETTLTTISLSCTILKSMVYSNKVKNRKSSRADEEYLNRYKIDTRSFITDSGLLIFLNAWYSIIAGIHQIRSFTKRRLYSWLIWNWSCLPGVNSDLWMNDDYSEVREFSINQLVNDPKQALVDYEDQLKLISVRTWP